jgi:hypothetical protein
MRKFIILILSMWFGLFSRAQNYSKTISVCSGNYSLFGEVLPDHSKHISISDINDDTKKVDYNYKGNDISDFASLFQAEFLKIGGIICTASEKNMILAEGNKLWYQLVSLFPAPKAGLLTIKSGVSVFGPLYNTQKKRVEQIHSVDLSPVQEVHIEMNSGYIETIYAIILVNDVPRTYINLYGIGFSSFQNYGNLDSIKLVELHTKPFIKSSRDTTKPIYTYIRLSELLQYNPDLQVDRRDFSPKDTAFTLSGGQTIQLYKQESTKLFEAHIFSDFVGLKEDKSNGLIQTEVAKQINLNSEQWITNRFLYGAFKSWGILQYITPSITISKLEQHNKRLLLGDLDSIRFNPGPNDTSQLNRSVHRYITILNLYQHQSFSAGFDLNLFYFSNHSLKYNVYFNFGARLGIIPVSDSLTIVKNDTITKTGSSNEFSLNALELIPEVRAIFLPEERFNFSIAYQCMYIRPFKGGLQLLAFDRNNPAKYVLNNNHWLNTFELLMAYNVNPDSKLFGRVKFNSELNNYNNNFAQIQIGYSTYIIGH